METPTVVLCENDENENTTFDLDSKTFESFAGGNSPMT